MATQENHTNIDFLLQEEPQPEKKKTPKKTKDNEIVRAPWVPLAIAQKTIALLTGTVIILGISSIALTSVVFTQLNRKPWIVGYTSGTYTELDPQKFRVTRDDVEIFLGDTIPRLYGTINGQAPGLEMLSQSVNPNILATQRENVDSQSETLKAQGISQFAIVTGLIPNTLVINRSQNFVYAEATGVVMLTKDNRSTPSEVQWRCLIYIVNPLTNMTTKTPGGRIAGNQYGLYLQQILEQAPGTVNPDSPRPTTQDEQERQEQEIRRSQSAMPTLKLE